MNFCLPQASTRATGTFRHGQKKSGLPTKVKKSMLLLYPERSDNAMFWGGGPGLCPGNSMYCNDNGSCVPVRFVKFNGYRQYIK